MRHESSHRGSTLALNATPQGLLDRQWELEKEQRIKRHADMTLDQALIAPSLRAPAARGTRERELAIEIR